MPEFALSPELSKGARFTNCRRYRFVLWRIWEPNARIVAFIGLNPSTADERTDDPTIRRCMGFARAWGFGGIHMLNLFAYRATRPADLMAASDPAAAGDDFCGNDYALQLWTARSARIVACWGAHGTFMDRGQQVLAMLRPATIHCFGLTANGQPKHPLYLARTTELQTL